MKARIVKSVLSRKFSDFLDSIDDSSVKALVKDHTIITGGSIASLLTREKVNDYDLYFTNFETTEAVVKYYLNKFTNTPEFRNGQKVKIYYEVEDGRIKIVVKSQGVANADGSNNYQYFEQIQDPESTESLEFVEQVTKEIVEDDSKPKYRPIFLSSNAITLSHSIQLIIRFYGEAEDIHKNFDFVHLKNYWTSKDNKLVLNPKSLEYLLTKELVYEGGLYPLASIIRTKKFLKRGFTINAGQYLKILYQVSKLNLDDIKVLEDQLTGVDAAYFMTIIEGLKTQMEKPGFTLTFEYLASIIDKVFE